MTVRRWSLPVSPIHKGASAAPSDHAARRVWGVLACPGAVRPAKRHATRARCGGAACAPGERGRHSFELGNAGGQDSRSRTWPWSSST
jgi:hypothetical protein